MTATSASAVSAAPGEFRWADCERQGTNSGEASPSRLTKRAGASLPSPLATPASAAPIAAPPMPMPRHTLYRLAEGGVGWARLGAHRGP
jgi:hypothetical protein